MSTTTSATKFKVHIHDGSFSLEELLVSPEWFSEIDDGTVVSLEFFSNSNDVDEKVAGGKRLLLRAKHFDVGSEGSSKRMQLSLLKRVAEARNLAPWMSATVTPIKDAERHGVEHVEFSFRDQFISRAEIWKFKKCVESEPVYVGKYFDVNGVRATASELRGKAGQLVDSALLSEHTKLIFRSRSTRIFWLVQMSYEMWEPNVGVDDDFLYVERIVDVFAAPLLKRWRQLDVTHSLSVLFFTRIENVDGDGKYEDLYRVALENKQADRIDEVALVASLKRE